MVTARSGPTRKEINAQDDATGAFHPTSSANAAGRAINGYTVPPQAEIPTEAVAGATEKEFRP